MSYSVRAVLGAVAFIALGSATQAADYDNSFNSGGYEVQQEGTEFRAEAPFRHRREWSGDRYYGRPVPEHRWARPVFARPGWRRDDCRVIIKERINRWGERVTRRIEVCD